MLRIVSGLGNFSRCDDFARVLRYVNDYTADLPYGHQEEARGEARACREDGAEEAF